MTDYNTARLASEWHEEDGNVLWWNLPINEPPYCGTPLDTEFPVYKTHWTPLIVPQFAHTSTADLAMALGESPEQAQTTQRGVDAVIRRENMKQSINDNNLG